MMGMPDGTAAAAKSPHRWFDPCGSCLEPTAMVVSSASRIMTSATGCSVTRKMKESASTTARIGTASGRKACTKVCQRVARSIRAARSSAGSAESKRPSTVQACSTSAERQIRTSDWWESMPSAGVTPLVDGLHGGEAAQF